MGSLTQQRLSLSLALLITGLLTYHVIYSLSFLKNTVWPEIYLSRIAVAFMGFFLSITLGWFGARLVGGILFAAFASMIVFFASGIAKSSVFVWYVVEYGVLCFLLLRMDQEFENQISGFVVDHEKDQNQKNDLEISYKVKGEGISIFFEKYSTYYNLRKLAEELSTTLSVSQLAEIVVHRASDFIPRGDIAVLTLADADGKNLSVVAAKQLGKERKLHAVGDMFDAWAISNRKRLIVFDSHEDFRFDVRETTRQDSFRSLIIVPLLHQGRVMGTVRMNSHASQTFSNDDLRVLDTIAVLASSALSNAMLYEQTKELSIRDSLTGLYVRRYFFERFKEEHRRFLLNNRPLSLLMCDLDHFKECNDRHGHTVGDLILTHISQILVGSAQNGLVARYGGEEFAVLLPETSKQDALATAEKIRKAIEDSPLVVRREKIPMTISIGVANLPEDTLDSQILIQKSDQALYGAKKKGRNQVCSSES